MIHRNEWCYGCPWHSVHVVRDTRAMVTRSVLPPELWSGCRRGLISKIEVHVKGLLMMYCVVFKMGFADARYSLLSIFKEGRWVLLGSVTLTGQPKGECLQSDKRGGRGLASEEALLSFVSAPGAGRSVSWWEVTEDPKCAGELTMRVSMSFCFSEALLGNGVEQKVWHFSLFLICFFRHSLPKSPCLVFKTYSVLMPPFSSGHNTVISGAAQEVGAQPLACSFQGSMVPGLWVHFPYGGHVERRACVGGNGGGRGSHFGSATFSTGSWLGAWHLWAVPARSPQGEGFSEGWEDSTSKAGVVAKTICPLSLSVLVWPLWTKACARAAVDSKMERIFTTGKLGVSGILEKEEGEKVFSGILRLPEPQQWWVQGACRGEPGFAACSLRKELDDHNMHEYILYSWTPWVGRRCLQGTSRSPH